ncbi:hypothetical protein ONZ45_g18991 [Pleurotus djamor]|nr:hypothetical protein ONZ45_g18991 [Pleurotus djamor]
MSGNETDPAGTSGGSGSGASNEPGIFNAERVKELESIVERFKQAEITRGEAGRLLYQQIENYTDVSQAVRDVAVVQFMEQIQSHVDAMSRAAKHGKQRAGDDGGRQLSEDEEEENPSGEDGGQRGVSVGRGRARDEEEEADADGKDDEDGQRSNKKAKVLESDLPWYKASQSTNITDAYTAKTLKIYRVFSNDPKYAKKELLNTIGIPSFPDSQWDAIIRGQMVDLDVVLSSQYAIRPVTEHVERLGDHMEIKNGIFETARKVTTAAEWIGVWYETSRAYVFCFPHREDELREYGLRIQQLFTAKVASFHPRVITFDKALRARLSRERHLRFTDRDVFEVVKQAVLEPNGVESSTPSPKPSPIRPRSSEPCDRFNLGTCPNSSGRCRYNHICKICKKFGHGASRCSQGSSSSARPTSKVPSA